MKGYNNKTEKGTLTQLPYGKSIMKFKKGLDIYLTAQIITQVMVRKVKSQDIKQMHFRAPANF